MTDPILHKQTNLQLLNYLNNPSHALLLHAEEGSGKYHIACWLAAVLKSEAITIEVGEEKKQISLEQIQLLYQHTKTGRRLTIIIKDAHLMGKDAQNALLKLLEEPPANTYFILTCNHEHALLQTIRSRSQMIAIKELSTRELMEAFQESSPNLKSLIKTTGGKIGRINTLLDNQSELANHDSLVSMAKQYYSSTHYDRLKILHDNGFDRQWSLQLLKVLSVIIESLLESTNYDSKQYQRLIQQASDLESTAKALVGAGNPKIHLARLSLVL